MITVLANLATRLDTNGFLTLADRLDNIIVALATEEYENQDDLTDHTKDMHRALISLQEELQAIDKYQQRADAEKDEELKRLLVHNQIEEMEHAAKLLEWLRRNVPEFETKLKSYLFTDKDLGRDKP